MTLGWTWYPWNAFGMAAPQRACRLGVGTPTNIVEMGRTRIVLQDAGGKFWGRARVNLWVSKS